MAHPNVRDRVELARLAEEQAALRRVATLVARGASPAEVFEIVAAEVARLLESDFSLVGRYETDGTLTHIASHPLELLSQLGPRTVLDGDDLASVVHRSGEPNSISYDDAPGPVAALARELGVRCAVGAPILVDDQIWGVMAAGWAVPEKASSEAAERTAEFTALVATALANTESRNEITRLAEEQAALRRVATLVAEGAATGRGVRVGGNGSRSAISGSKCRSSQPLRGGRHANDDREVESSRRIRLRWSAIPPRRGYSRAPH